MEYLTNGETKRFSRCLITEHVINTVPWDDAGPSVRFSVTFAAKDLADEQRVLTEIAKRLLSAAFEL
jgi:LL-diaminopimelate aminotransferase